ncbi:MAG TPA: hypothetical protein VG897_00255 [Terriglobales bacterium]|nr:hypothetical protein [Terriglobales bacterium]
MADHQGTGKHPHKSTEDPHPHRRASGQKHAGPTGQHERHEASGSDSRDLKEREYRDKDGNIHHHTHTSKEMK